MNDERYLRGKIYEIVNDVSDKRYVGSTVNELRVRFNQHKTKFKRGTITVNSKLIFDEHFNTTKIILIEEYPCDNKMQLHKRERYWIEYFGRETCVNKYIPTRTSKEYHKDNKEQIKEYYKKNNEKRREQMKEYREINKEEIREQMKEYRKRNNEKIRERRKEKVKCGICDCEVSRYNVSRHKKSKKHLNNLLKNN